MKRLAKYMNVDKRRLLFKSFLESQFSYCPLIWMFHNRTLNSKINGLHERALRIVYDNYELSFDELLFIDNSYCSHHKNIQTLAIEMYKQKHGLSPEIVENVFVTCDEPDDFKCIRNRTVCYGDNSLRSFGPHVWKMLPESIKASETLAVFKDKVRQWRPSECSCRLCKLFIQGVGFIN